MSRTAVRPPRRTTVTRCATALVLCAAQVALARPADAAAGSLDPSFGRAGRVRTDFEVVTSLGQRDFARDVAVQPDGRIVVAAGGWSTFGLARYLADGRPDPGFGHGGKVVTRDGPHGDSVALVLQRDGRILVAGGHGGGVIVRRYLRDGRADRSFGRRGVAMLFGGSLAGAAAMAVQPGGRILVAGHAIDQLSFGARDDTDLVVAGFSPDGKLDTGFGSGGITWMDAPYTSEIATDMTLAPDGAVVVAGWRYVPDLGIRPTLVRLTSSGQIDLSFVLDRTITDPRVALATEQFADAVVMRPDGRILVAGFGVPTGVSVGDTAADLMVWQLRADGSLDPGFGRGGVVATDVAGKADVARDLVLQDDGGVVLLGFTQRGDSPAYDGSVPWDHTRPAMILVRYRADGALDGSFGSGGIVTSRFPATFGGGWTAGALQRDGRILAAGFVFERPRPFRDGWQVALARYTAR